MLATSHQSPQPWWGLLRHDSFGTSSCFRLTFLKVHRGLGIPVSMQEKLLSPHNIQASCCNPCCSVTSARTTPVGISAPKIWKCPYLGPNNMVDFILEIPYRFGPLFGSFSPNLSSKTSNLTILVSPLIRSAAAWYLHCQEASPGVAVKRHVNHSVIQL